MVASRNVGCFLRLVQDFGPQNPGRQPYHLAYMHMCMETHGTLGRRLNRAYDFVLVNSNCLFKLQKKEFLSYDCFKFSHKLK